MKKLLCLAVVLFAVTAIPAAAQPQYCFGGGPTYCQYVANQDFYSTSSPWTFTSSSARASVTDGCLGGSNNAASLTPGGGVFQWFDTEDDPKWGVEFTVYFGSSGGNSDDKVYVEVTNATYFNQVEQYAISATNYGTCAQIYIPLENLYDDSSVRLRFWRDYDSTMSSIAVDDISFWGGPSN
jgi:hypothetical protein